jgi:Ni,Fe-hydrogenase I large subunit
MTRVVIDPVTRIEGHLRVEVEVENGVVKNAWSSGTMFRGWEVLLQGKDPRDASYVTERVCGVCAGSHGSASAMALDAAYGANVPTGGRLIRNLILGGMYMHDHPLHFYHLCALDYIDVMAVANYKGKDAKLLAVKDKIVKLVQMGDTSPLTPRYNPDKYCVNDPEIVTTAVAHYLQALEMQAKAKKMSAIFSGKQPHQSSILLGGVTMFPTVEQIQQYKSMLVEQIDFIENVYFKDVLAFGTGPLLELAQSGFGGFANFLSFGGFPNDDAGKDLFFKAGVILDGDINNVQEVDLNKIVEESKYAWYKGDDALNPGEGKTEYDRDKKDAYSFIKAPRYDGRAMEVGPLARMLIMKPQPLMDIITKYKIKPGVVARHAARAYETIMLGHQLLKWCDELLEATAKGNLKIHDTDHWETPESGKGYGLLEAPRGALGHWINIKDKKIANYQMVVPSTWNLSPKDNRDALGPVEQALIGVPVPDVNNPINVVRVIRSYDPCISCAVHLIEPKTNEILKFQIS